MFSWPPQICRETISPEIVWQVIPMYETKSLGQNLGIHYIHQTSYIFYIHLLLTSWASRIHILHIVGLTTSLTCIMTWSSLSLNSLTICVWNSTCSGHGLHSFTSIGLLSSTVGSVIVLPVTKQSSSTDLLFVTVLQCRPWVYLSRVMEVSFLQLMYHSSLSSVTPVWCPFPEVKTVSVVFFDLWLFFQVSRSNSPRMKW
jgi:hypothetical protein